MAGVRDHTGLDVWKLCDDLRQRVRPVVDRPAFGARKAATNYIVYLQSAEAPHLPKPRKKRSEQQADVENSEP